MAASLSKSVWLKIFVLAGAIVLLFEGVVWYRQSARPASSSLRTAQVERGDLLATVSASGTIEPIEVVDVGAQVMGMIKEFGRDPHDSTKPIDYLSAVEEGTVLARIDDALYRARVDRAAAQIEQVKAQIEQAEADVRRAQANTQQAQAKHQQAERDLERARRLQVSGAISQEDFDARQALDTVAMSDLRVSEAQVDQAKANKLVAEKALLLAQAELRESQQNLDYTVIRSPVKGVIVDRRVNVGQTVVSSLNAPSLFLIARDLKQLEVWASVNEADVGRIHPGQNVAFTVDAFPDEVFQGLVSQVRLNASMTQNVVTYTVAVATPNSSGRLLPYLTANVQFEVGRCENALLVPNSALRWQPKPEQIASDIRQQYVQQQNGRNAQPSARSQPAPPTASLPGSLSNDMKKAHNRGQVWVEEKGTVRPLEVQLGLTDGLHTEITGGQLQAGQQVVIGEELPAEVGGTNSPFTPQPFRRR